MLTAAGAPLAATTYNVIPKPRLLGCAERDPLAPPCLVQGGAIFLRRDAAMRALLAARYYSRTPSRERRPTGRSERRKGRG